jgi:hypothetical protein
VTDREYEKWRPALIAFYRAQGPWFGTIRHLEMGGALTPDNKHDIDGLAAAFAVVPMKAAA